MAKCRPNKSLCGMKDGLFNPFFTGNYANPYSYSGGDTPDPGFYVSESGSGDGTQGDPFGPSEFKAALATIPEGSTIYFNKGDIFI